MKAAIRREYGSPDVIRIEEFDMPKPKADEVLVKVHATTVNRTDCAILTGSPWAMRLFTGLSEPKHPTLGTDFAGVVEKVGSSVKGFKKGDRVWGFQDDSAYSQAEYVAFSEKKAIDIMPRNISFQQAVASIEGAHYAYNFLKRLKLNENKRVMLNGATGAIGSALLQFVKYYGVEVVATSKTKKLELISSLGADRVIDYMNEDFTKDSGQYDYVLDAVGKSRFSKCKTLLKKGGVYMSSELGPNAENPFLALFTSMLGSKKVVFPVPSDIKGSLSFIRKLIEEEKFKAVIDRTYYPLKKIKDAYKYVLTGEKTGNVVIEIA